MRRHEPDDEIRSRGDGVAAVLRREAFAGRPACSDLFHDRLMRRVAADAGPTPAAGMTSRGPRPGRDGGRAAARRAAAWAVVTLTVVVAALGFVIVTSGTDGGAWSLGRPAVVDAGAAEAAPATIAGGEPLGIDRLPTLDEIESGVHEGVASLASALFEVPEWTALADLDATAVLPSVDVP